MLVEQYGGRVPDTMEELLKLPGVGRKTANLILGDVYHTPGVVVADTHCIRITGRLGLTDGTKDPAKVEEQLRPTLPPEGAPRPGGVYGPQARLPQLYPAPLVRFLHKVLTPAGEAPPDRPAGPLCYSCGAWLTMHLSFHLPRQ